MRRITSICLGFFTAFMLFVGVAVAAPEYTGNYNDDMSVMLIDANTGQVLHQHNADKVIYPASTTKILTCIVALERASLSDEVIVGRNADSGRVRGSRLYIVEGEKINMEDLLNGMMMVSGNDAAIAVAEHVAGSTDAFVDMMNEKAQQIGMTSSNFTNVNGLDKQNPQVTASDMAKLAQYAFANKTFMEIVDRTSYDMPETNKRPAKTEKNTNHLLHSDDERYYPYVNGMKTGWTTEAGACIVASASKDGTDLIVLIFGDQTDDGSKRWPLVIDLFNHGFNNYKTVSLQDLLADIDPIQEQVEGYAANDINDGLLQFQDITQQYVTLEKSVADALESGSDSIEAVPTFTDPLPLTAPILEGDMLGTVAYKSKQTGDTIFTGNLLASRDILESGTEPNANGGTAVATMPPTVPEEIVTQRDSSGIWLWLLIPVALIAFLVFRLVTVNRRKNKRFKRKTPHYSYRIKR